MTRPCSQRPYDTRGEPLQQLRTHHRGIWQILTLGRTRTRRAKRSETRLGDGRMNQQRSSGGEKFVRGLLVLPELRRPSLRDTPKITKPVRQRSTRVTAAVPYSSVVDLETTVPVLHGWPMTPGQPSALRR